MVRRCFVGGGRKERGSSVFCHHTIVQRRNLFWSLDHVCLKFWTITSHWGVMWRKRLLRAGYVDIRSSQTVKIPKIHRNCASHLKPRENHHLKLFSTAIRTVSVSHLTHDWAHVELDGSNVRLAIRFSLGSLSDARQRLSCLTSFPKVSKSPSW